MYARGSVEVEDAGAQLSTAEIYVKVEPIPAELLASPCLEDYSIELHEREYVPQSERPAGWIKSVST